jgi:7,8-dihydro-6-hydroxymethylpterin-pyrophosphokinase
VKAFIGLGSNLGDREANLRSALEHLAHAPETTVVRASSLYSRRSCRRTSCCGT